MVVKAESVLNRISIIKVQMDNGKIKSIKYSQVRKWWSYANQLDIEYCKCKIYGNRVIFAMTTGSGQGGVICIWNCDSDMLEHISEASYIYDFVIDNEYIYSLHEIYNFMMPVHYRIYRTKIGVMNAWNENAELLYADAPQKLEGCSGIEIDGKKMVVNTKKGPVVFSEDFVNAIKPKKEYQYLYDIPDQSDPDYRSKVVKRLDMVF